MAKPISDKDAAEKPRIGTKTVVLPPVTIETIVYSVEFVKGGQEGPRAVVKLREIEHVDETTRRVLREKSVEILPEDVATFLFDFATTLKAEEDEPWWDVRGRRVDEWLAAIETPPPAPAEA